MWGARRGTSGHISKGVGGARPTFAASSAGGILDSSTASPPIPKDGLWELIMQELPPPLEPAPTAERRPGGGKGLSPPPPRPMTADQGFPPSSSSAGDWCLLPPVLGQAPLPCWHDSGSERLVSTGPTRLSIRTQQINSQPRAETIPLPLSPLPSRPWRVDRGRKGQGPARGQAKGGFFLD